MTLRKKGFENIVWKAGNADNRTFSFSHIFYPFKDNFHHFNHTWFIVFIYLCISSGLKLCLLVYVMGKKHKIYSINESFNPLPDDKILDWSKLKQIADDILKCIWNEK